MTERRSRRSKNQVEALTLFLESQQIKLRSRGLAVTTRDGKLLAGVGPGQDRLARTAIEIHEARPEAAGVKTRVATWWLRAGGVEVILASQGGRLCHDLG